jgi:NADPH:quinone reductase-like Zn-dependent oxidoreductase
VQVAGIRATGAPVETIELPDPRPLRDDEVLIELRAAGVANWDELVRVGDWDVGRPPPTALGVQGAGVITEVGDAVRGWAPGDEVMTHPVPLREHGTWAPWVIATASLLARKPSAISWEEAATFPVPALTAEQVLAETLRITRGEHLLIHGAGGVAGGVLVTLASHYGAEVIATARTQKQDRLRTLGARLVLDYNDTQWPAQVRAQTDNAGVHAAVNAAPGGASAAIRAVRDGGRLATITSDPPDVQRGIQVANVYVRSDGAQLQRLAGLVGAGRLAIRVAASLPLANAAEALDKARGGRAGGAVVLTMSPEARS